MIYRIIIYLVMDNFIRCCKFRTRDEMGDIMVKLASDGECTGCFACYNACTRKAVIMKLDAEGFYKPEIDYDKCSSCGNCSRACPVMSFNNNNSSEAKVYAGFSNDDSIRAESSSGGIFSEIARMIIENDGIVYGAAWGKDLKVYHTSASSMDELKLLRSSKYIQSNIGYSYREAANSLKSGKKVLFTGVPCQIAALKKMIPDNENLILVDVLCHGVPSYKVFEKYIQSKAGNEKVVLFTFRDKSKGWSKYSTRIVLQSGREYNCITKEDPFFHGFICDLYLNKSCYNCRFSRLPRVGDVTIGDFWRISEDLFDERGVSVILVNNDKGERVINNLKTKGNINLFEKTLASAVAGNPRIESGHLRMRDRRQDCLDLLDKGDFDEIYEKYIKDLKRYVY